MINLAEIEALLLILATAGYVIAMGVYWKFIFSGRETTSWWASRIALGALLVHAVWFGIRTYHLGFLPLYRGHDFSSTFAAGAVIAVFGALGGNLFVHPIIYAIGVNGTSVLVLSSSVFVAPYQVVSI